MLDSLPALGHWHHVYLFAHVCLFALPIKHLWLPCGSFFFLPSLSLYSNIPHYAAYGHPSVSVPNVSIRGFSLSPTSLFMFRFTPVAAFRQAAAAADAHFEAFQPELRAAQDA